MKHRLLLLYTWFVRLVLIWLPDQPFTMRFRGMLYGLAMPSCGSDFQVSGSVVLRNLENIIIGNNVYLAPGVIINAIDRVILGNEVMLGFNAIIVTGNHTRHENSFRYGTSAKMPIEIGAGSWIGANSTILPGAGIGQCSVLAANSALTKSVPDYSVYGGVPAKFIKNLVHEQILPLPR